MAPPVSAIPVSELETQLNTLPSGRPRNPPIVLGDCALKELVQYKCNIHQSERKRGPPRVICEPVVRMLRNEMDTRLTSIRCEGGPSVETTAWEGWKAKQRGANGEK